MDNNIIKIWENTFESTNNIYSFINTFTIYDIMVYIFDVLDKQLLINTASNISYKYYSEIEDIDNYKFAESDNIIEYEQYIIENLGHNIFNIYDKNSQLETVDNYKYLYICSKFTKYKNTNNKILYSVIEKILKTIIEKYDNKYLEIIFKSYKYNDIITQILYICSKKLSFMGMYHIHN